MKKRIANFIIGFLIKNHDKCLVGYPSKNAKVSGICPICGKWEERNMYPSTPIVTTDKSEQ